LSVSIISLLVMGVVSSRAQPVGASVVAGQAQVSTSGATTVINQSTAKAIINWQNFSVAQGSAVQFNQPNSTSLTLNRVTGPGLSSIDGAIRANGQVWLLNPNGLLFGNHATINVGGLLATTSDIANQDFIEGRYNFTAGRNSIVNNGSIHSAHGGSVVLSAPNVVNNGLIQANAGHVVLGGTDTFTVDFRGDRLLSYAIGANSTGGKVTNAGKISAPGGRILLTARAASGVQDAVINNTGMVEATSVREEKGEIILEAEDGGVTSSGTLDASGNGAGEAGGTVKVLGKDVALTDGATVDVSGDAGGGSALIGGNFHGAGAEQRAANTSIGKVSIKADAVSRGSGGKVAVWSDGTTRLAGHISAKGGAASGNGGQVETSGHDLSITGSSVEAGKGGTWLLDPYDLTVDATAATSINSTLGGGTNVTLQTNAASASGPGVQNAAGNGDIFINAPISWSTGASLTLDAYHSIQVNAPIRISGAGDLNLYVNHSGSGGDYSFASGANVDYGATNNGGTLHISNSGGVTNAASYALLYSTTAVQNINNDLNSGLFPDYALATSLDATGISGWTPIGVDGSGNAVNGNGFASVFEGLGNAISNLAVNQGANFNQALFGYSHGTVRDIGLIGGSVTGASSSAYLGALVGRNFGTVANSYATGTVSGGGAGRGGVGGLVGQNESTGTVTNSFASGAITLAAGGNYAGGLVALNFGTVSNSYATGEVSGNNSPNVGGLVGINFGGGSISTSFATGVVTGASGSFGGLVGSNAGTVTGSYWDTDNTSTDNSGSGAVGQTTAVLSGALPSGFSPTLWANVGNQTTPYLISNQTGSVLIDSTGGPIIYSLIFTMPQLQAVNNNLFGNYALANSLDATNTTNWVPLGVDGSGNVQGDGLGFASFFNGLGNTVNNLTVNTPHDYAGLFGYSAGIISNLGVVGGSVTGANNVGGLAGYSRGTISNSYSTASVHGSTEVGGLVGQLSDGQTIGNSYATGAVTANGGSQYAGGLVGLNSGGGISASYATGSVSDITPGGGVQVGGLVGGNMAGSYGSISDSYSMGAVSGSNANVGGIVGINNGTITDAYSTGAVFGGNHGGLIGGNGGTVTNSYWNTDTSGQAVGIAGGSTSGAAGLPTSFLQTAGVPAGFSTYVWGSALSFYPYLLFQGVPQVIAGTVSSDAGVTPLGSSAKGIVTVSSLVNGVSSSNATAGANGYYYMLQPSGTFSGNKQLLTYINNSIYNTGVVSNDYFQNISSNPTGGDLFSNRVLVVSPATSVSSVYSGFPTALGAKSGSDFLFSSGVVNSGRDLTIQSTGAGGLSIDTVLTLGNAAFTVNAVGPVTQTMGITATNLTVTTTGLGSGIALNAGTNVISGTVSLSSTGNVFLANSQSTTLGTSTAGGTLTVVSANDLTIASGAVVSSQVTSGPDVVLSAAGHFINSSGSNAVRGGGNNGRIYSHDPSGDVFGNLDSGNFPIWNTTYPTAVSAAGNRYIFAVQPNIIVTTNNLSKTYGTNISGAVANDYSISGLQGGVGNAYLAATAAEVYSGAPSVTSAGAAANAGVVGSPYAITAAAGSLSIGDGYGLSFQNSTLTVTPQTLAYDAISTTRTYGAANPVLHGGVSGFVNGDTLASATSGVLAFTSAATAASSVGSYSISGSGLSAANYIFTQAAANAAALTINPATLTYVANASTLTYGPDNPSFSGTVTGFVNGQTQATATSGTPVFIGTASGTSGPGIYAINGSGLTAANYVFTQAAGNATALTIVPATLLYVANAASRTYGASNPAFGGSVTGFVNGQTLATATSGKLTFSSTVAGTSGLGSYAINGSGLTAANYVFTQAAGNATALTITPATLLYVANAASRAVGATNPPLSGNVTGFFNGETQASVASGTLVFTATAALTSAAGSYAVNGSGLSATNYIFVQAPGNATALTITPPLMPPVDTTTLDMSGITVLTGFTAAIQPPPLNSPLNNTVLGNAQGAANAPPPPPPPPAPPPPASPPPPPPGGTPLADNNTAPDGQPAEAPNSSDQATSAVADSLDGGAPAEASAPVITGMLASAKPPPPPPLEAGALPSFGNLSLWQ
jgi:filamentous hemagglutinin family protein